MPNLTRRLHLPAAVLLVGTAMGCASVPPLAKDGPVSIRARGDSPEIEHLDSLISSSLDDIRSRLELPPPGTALEVLFFDSSWGMQAYLRQHCPEQSGKAAACFSRDGGYTITLAKSVQPGRTERLLRHELTHYLLASNYRDLPPWIDEGLAQYLEVLPSGLGDEKHLEFRKRCISWSESAILNLVDIPSSRPLDREQYLLSWAFVTFLMHDPPLGPSRVKGYLGIVESGGSMQPSFESAFGPMPTLSPRWYSFLALQGLSPCTSPASGMPPVSTDEAL